MPPSTSAPLRPGPSPLLRAFSFGGGVQSTACLVLAAQGLLPVSDDDFKWDVFMFANVGERAESPDTLRYVSEVCRPYAEANGIEFVELRKVKRGGSPDDLLDMVDRQAWPPIPVRMASGAPGTRSCTRDFKIKVINKELVRRGAKDEDGVRAIVGIGISLDEIQRAKGWGEIDPRTPERIREYPLLRLGLRRADAIKIIAEAGLPPAPRSACWFCPFHTLDEWRHLRQTNPGLFDQAVSLEQQINEKRRARGKDDVYLTKYGRPISEVVHDQLTLGLDDPGTGDAPCDTGYCFT